MAPYPDASRVRNVQRRALARDELQACAERRLRPGYWPAIPGAELSRPCDRMLPALVGSADASRIGVFIREAVMQRSCQLLMRRSATVAGDDADYHRCRPPRNKGLAIRRTGRRLRRSWR